MFQSLFKAKNNYRNGYDVLLVSSNLSRLSTCNVLKRELRISSNNASKLIENLPAYLYTNIGRSTAEIVATRLQSAGMNIVLYDSNNKPYYYYSGSSINENYELPERRPWFNNFGGNRFNNYRYRPIIAPRINFPAPEARLIPRNNKKDIEE